MYKSKMDAYLCHVFFGFFGAGRFYVGDFKMGVIHLITFGGFGLLWLMDFYFLGKRVNRLNHLVEAMYSLGETTYCPIDRELLHELKRTQSR